MGTPSHLPFFCGVWLVGAYQMVVSSSERLASLGLYPTCERNAGGYLRMQAMLTNQSSELWLAYMLLRWAGRRGVWMDRLFKVVAPTCLAVNVLYGFGSLVLGLHYDLNTVSLMFHLLDAVPIAFEAVHGPVVLAWRDLGWAVAYVPVYYLTSVVTAPLLATPAYPIYDPFEPTAVPIALGAAAVCVGMALELMALQRAFRSVETARAAAPGAAA